MTIEKEKNITTDENLSDKTLESYLTTKKNELQDIRDFLYDLKDQLPSGKADELKINDKIIQIDQITAGEIIDQKRLKTISEDLKVLWKDLGVLITNKELELTDLQSQKFITLTTLLKSFSTELDEYKLSLWEGINKNGEKKLGESGWRATKMGAGVLAMIGSFALIRRRRKKRKEKKEAAEKIAAGQTTNDVTQEKDGRFKRKRKKLFGKTETEQVAEKKTGWFRKFLIGTGIVGGSTAALYLGGQSSWWKKSKTWFNGLFENAEKKKAAQVEATEMADKIDGLSFDKDGDSYTFEIDGVEKTKERSLITNENELNKWIIDMKEEVEGQKDAVKLAEQVEDINFDNENDEFVFEYKGVKKRIRRYKITSLAALRQRKINMETEISKDIVKETSNDDIKEKLRKDPNYKKQCEDIGGYVNKFYEGVDASFKPLGSDSFEIIDITNKTYSAGIMIGWMDTVYSSVNSLFKEETISDLGDNADTSSLGNFFGKISFKAKVHGLALLGDSIPEVEKEDLQWGTLNLDSLMGDISNADDTTKRKIDDKIEEIEKNYANHFDNLKLVFLKQMQIITYFRKISKKVSFNIAKKILLKNNPNIFQNIKTEESQQEFINNKLETDSEFQAKVSDSFYKNFGSKGISELLDSSNSESDTILDAMLNPINKETKADISNLEANKNRETKKIDRLIKKYDAIKTEKMANKILNDIEEYYGYRRHSIFSETIKNGFNMDTAKKDEIIRNLYSSDILLEEKNSANEILRKIKNKEPVVKEDLEKLKKAYESFYNMQKQHELHGETRVDIHEDDDGYLVYTLATNYLNAWTTWGGQTFKGFSIAMNNISDKDPNGVVVGVGTAAISLFTLDAMTWAPRKLWKSGRFVFSKDVKTISLKASPTDRLLRNTTNFTRNKMGHQVGKLLPLYARKYRKFVGGGRFYKSRERLLYDLVENKFGTGMTMQRAIDIANYNKLSGTASVTDISIIKKLAGEFNISHAQATIIAKYMKENPDLLHKNLFKSIKAENSFKRLFSPPWKNYTYSFDATNAAFQNLKMVDGLANSKLKNFYKGVLNSCEDLGSEAITKIIANADSITPDILKSMSNGLDLEDFGKSIGAGENPTMMKILSDDSALNKVQKIFADNFIDASKDLSSKILKDDVVKQIEVDAKKVVNKNKAKLMQETTDAVPVNGTMTIYDAYDNPKIIESKDPKAIKQKYDELYQQKLTKEIDKLKNAKILAEMDDLKKTIGTQKRAIFNLISEKYVFDSVDEITKFTDDLVKMDVMSLSSKQINNLIDMTDDLDSFKSSLKDIAKFQSDLDLDLQIMRSNAGARGDNIELHKYYTKQISELEELKAFKNMSLEEINLMSKIYQVDELKANKKIFTSMMETIKGLSESDSKLLKNANTSDEIVSFFRYKGAIDVKEEKLLKTTFEGSSGIKFIKIARVMASEDSIIKSMFKVFGKIL